MAYDPKKVINIALKEVGYLEKKNGDSRYLNDKTKNAGMANYTKYGKEMHELYPKTMDYPAAWCDCFVDWCFYKAYGYNNAMKIIGGNFDDYTVNSAGLYKNKKAWHIMNPKVGDQIFFKNSAGKICHTGIVYAVDSKYVYTVEGNTIKYGVPTDTKGVLTLHTATYNESNETIEEQNIYDSGNSVIYTRIK